ncbi:MAG: inositol monophosphatase family protein [Blastocatellia bacterium]
MNNELHDLLQFALRMARAAEAEILPRYRNCAISLKADGSEVTEADKRAEQVIREMLARELPEHDILGEEYGVETNAGGQWRWLIDPIDGTASFTMGVPLFGTLIALLQNNDPVLGVIHAPALRETYYATRGGGSWMVSDNGDPVRLHVREAAPLNAATITATGAHNSDINPAVDKSNFTLTPVIRAARKFRFGGDCLQYGLVARGSIHAGIDTAMNPWDIAALVPCVEEAGGVITTLHGARDNIVFGGSILASCDAALHQEILALIKPL